MSPSTICSRHIVAVGRTEYSVGIQSLVEYINYMNTEYVFIFENIPLGEYSAGFDQMDFHRMKREYISTPGL